MHKSSFEKAMGKQNKVVEKANHEVKIKEYATMFVSGQSSKYSLRIIDQDSEMMLKEILAQYDKNSNNNVDFQADNLSKSLCASIGIQYEKLKMYDVLSSVIQYMTRAIITLSDTAKVYF